MSKSKIKLTESDRETANEFMHKRMNQGQQNMYAARGGFKSIDLVCGALGEIAAYKFLKSKKIAVSKPDFSIHEVKNKSFNADLTADNGALYHVKSQTTQSVERVGRSYLFQKRDPLFTRPSENDYLLLITVDLVNLVAEIHGVMRVIDVIECGGISEPVLEHLRGNKCAIYVDELDELLTEEQKWRL